ncbi:VOC family protein [Hafnia alvei]|uniref:VOC family protein n=1 Tax=Hafnia alvei TaxID=569 RepID=UPI000E05600B|nr:VOC family protein [Hafnia alvei]TBL37969.1 VOC family protein [Hafnia alvei]STQ71793.1 Virulence protein STM3117 [Hafnia alvei]
MLKLSALDHLVLTVANIDKSVQFYQQVLGMGVETFGSEGRTALTFGEQKINLHAAKSPFRPHAKHPTPGSADLCFITVQPLQEIVLWVIGCGVEIIEGPVTRTGATGKISSIYLRDPDGNLIEIANRL